MELSLESLTPFRPRTGTMEDWNAAYVRVEDYLRAHRIHNRLHSSRITQEVLEAAARRHEEDPTREPTTLAADEIESRMDAWFARVLGEKEATAERNAVEGRLGLLLCDGPQKWPYAFLNFERVPEDFAQAMQRVSINPAPDMTVSSMVPQPIDLGTITEAAGETLERFEQWPVLRTLFLWLVFAIVLGGIFRATR